MAYQPTGEVNKLLLALQRNEVALWLGADWDATSVESEKTLFANQDWYGIWSESKSRETAQVIRDLRGDDLYYKNFIEIPDELKEYLQPDFKFSNNCPFFYLNGYSQKDTLTPRKRLLTNLDKTSHLERLDQAFLVICGIGDADDAVNLFSDTLDGFIGNLGAIFITDVKDYNRWKQKFQENDSLRGILSKITLLSSGLSEILLLNGGKKGEEEQELIYIKGNKSIPLAPLLHTNPPVDQYFHILTQYDISPPSKKEEKQGFLNTLLANQSPSWRAFAHDLHWKRPVYKKANQKLRERLESFSKSGSADIHFIDIVAEESSGLTVMLQYLAFESAKLGYPSLFSRDTVSSVDCNVLSVFLGAVDRQLVERGLLNIPVVIFLDRKVISDDVTGDIRRLPSLLKKTARPVLLVRGIIGDEVLPETDTDMVSIRSVLNQEEIQSLYIWAKGHFESHAQNGTNLETIREWQKDDDNEIPLLVALDMIVTSELRSHAEFSDRLVSRFVQEVSNYYDKKESCKIEGETILVKGEPMELTLGIETARSIMPSKKDIAVVLMILVSIGRLKTKIPVSVLESMTKIRIESLREIIKLLEKGKLIRSDLLTDGDRNSPRANYTGLESVSLLYDLYALLLQRSLIERELGRELCMADSSLCCDYSNKFKKIPDEDDMPIVLLESVFESLQPGRREHIKYAELLSTRYLRISYDDDERSNRTSKLKAKIDDILGVYDNYLSSAMLHDSDILLHSYALSSRFKYNLIRPNDSKIDEIRATCTKAEDALLEALSLVEKRVGSEAQENLETTLGIIYRNRAIFEIKHPDGDKDQWVKYTNKARETFREVLPVSRSTYAHHALAELLVRELEIDFQKIGSQGYESDKTRLFWYEKLSDDEIGERLGEVLFLLSKEPDQGFQAKWNETKKRALELLVDRKANKIIKKMKVAKDELGYVLEAMQALEKIKNSSSIIPQNPTSHKDDIECIKKARGLLDEARRKNKTATDLGNLMRYALFSAIDSSNYPKRYELIKELLTDEGVLCYNEPIWLYDYAMLAFQNGYVSEGQKAFYSLRRRGLYKSVPYDRINIWEKKPRFGRPVIGSIKITRLDQQRDQGWGYFSSEEYQIQEPIPFRISPFRSQESSNLEVGKSIRCRVRLQSSGAYGLPSDGRLPST